MKLRNFYLNQARCAKEIHFKEKGNPSSTLLLEYPKAKQ